MKGKELLALRVKEHRQARGWSQYDLEERSGVHRNYIARVEAARVNVGIDLVQRLADGFRISLTELFAAPTAGSRRRT